MAELRTKTARQLGKSPKKLRTHRSMLGRLMLAQTSHHHQVRMQRPRRTVIPPRLKRLMKVAPRHRALEPTDLLNQRVRQPRNQLRAPRNRLQKIPLLNPKTRLQRTLLFKLKRRLQQIWRLRAKEYLRHQHPHLPRSRSHLHRQQKRRQRRTSLERSKLPESR